MLKNILNLSGAQQLSKKEQNAIHGGGGGLCFDQCYHNPGSCPSGTFCFVAYCYPDGQNNPSDLYGTCKTNEQ